MSYQKVTIVGNLGRDPEQRFMPDGARVTSFSVATNRRWTNADGSKGEEVAWFRVSAWGQLGEICSQYLSKGRQVMVIGRLVPDRGTGAPRIWTGQDGVPRASFELNANEVVFLGSSEQSGERTAPLGTETDDEIPF